MQKSKRKNTIVECISSFMVWINPRWNCWTINANLVENVITTIGWINTEIIYKV